MARLPNSSAPKSGKLPRILLVASLGLNVLLVGAIVGNAASSRNDRPRGIDLQIGPLGEALPPEDRAQIGRDLRRGIRDDGWTGQDRRAAADAVIEMLEAETFDAAAFEETIRAQRVRIEQLNEKALMAFVSHVGQMTVEERRAMAEKLKSRSGPGGDRKPPASPD